MSDTMQLVFGLSGLIGGTCGFIGFVVVLLGRRA
jgi:hypothetical protein